MHVRDIIISVVHEEKGMSTIQEALDEKREEVNGVVALVAEAKAGDTAPAVLEENRMTPVVADARSAEETEQFEAGLKKVMQQRLARRLELRAARPAVEANLEARRTDLEVKRARRSGAEDNLRGLYAERLDIEKELAEERQILADAIAAELTEVVPERRAIVEELELALMTNSREVAALETAYPDVKMRIETEQLLVARHHEFLGYFATMAVADGSVRYMAKGVPTPSMKTITASNAWLNARVQEAREGEMIAEASKGVRALFVAHNGSRWAPLHPEMDGAQVCEALAGYEKAIQSADQERLEKLAERDVADGLLLSPKEVERLKNHPENQHDFLGLIEARHGFCLVPIASDVTCDVVSYQCVPQEMLVEYVDEQDSIKKHVIRVGAVTAPHLVAPFFFFENRIRDLVFAFNSPCEMTGWKRINETIRDSLLQAFYKAVQDLRKAEMRKTDTVAWDDLSKTTDRKTIDQLADSEAGVAVVQVFKYGGRFDLGFKLVSDGTTVRASNGTSRSKKLRLYEELQDGKPVGEFFARHKDGSFQNDELQRIAVLNERSEIDWMLTPVSTATDSSAERIAGADKNIPGLVMPADLGGCDGTYLFTASVRDRDARSEISANREVAYMATRTGDKIVFIKGLTRYSRERFVQQGFEFGVSYVLNDVRGYMLYVLQNMYAEHLRRNHGDASETLRSILQRTKAADPAPEDDGSV